MVQLTVGVDVDSRGRESLRLAVSDTGIGFDAATRDRLFSRFEQADGGITRQFGGSGLGLAICRQLAGMMGGTLECESEPGGGSCFMLSVPLTRAATPDAETIEAPAAETREGLSVLIADDHPTNRKVVELILSQVQARMVLVDNGQQALDAYRDDTFDIVLMDMQMPVMDGLEATRRIRALPLARQPRIYAMSASVLDRERQACLDAGMDRHLAKPLRRQELEDILDELAQLNAKTVAAGDVPGDVPDLAALCEQLGDDGANAVLDAMIEDAEPALRELCGEDPVPALRRLQQIAANAGLVEATTLADDAAAMAELPAIPCAAERDALAARYRDLIRNLSNSAA